MADHILYALQARLLRFVTRPGNWLNPSWSRIYALGLAASVEALTAMLDAWSDTI